MSFRGNFWVPAAAIVFAGFTFNFIAVFPGLMSYDSFDMWNRAVELNFWDWSHPLINVLMAVGRLIRDDPSPYLFFQLGLLWSGIYMFTLALRNQLGKWVFVAAFFGLLPFILVLSGYLHKTPLLAACFLFSSSWLYLSYTRRKRLTIIQVTGLIMIVFLGSVVREYSYISSLPILSFMIWMLLQPINLRHVNVWAIAFAITVVVIFVGANYYLLYGLLDTKKTYKPQVVFMFDMAALYALTGNLIGEEFLKNEFKDRDAVIKLYEKEMKRSVWKIFDIYEMTTNVEEVRRMRNEWWRAVSENPRAYLLHRMDVMLRSLGVKTNEVRVKRGFGANSPKNIHNLKKLKTVFWEKMRIYIRSVNGMFFMMPWFWALLNVALSGIGVILFLKPSYRRLVAPHCVMLWSGVLLLAPYLLVCLSPDARFTYWTTVATFFGGFGLTCVSFARWKELHRKKEQQT